MKRKWKGMESLKRMVAEVSQTFENGDVRVQHWPLMSSPWPTVVLCIVYVLLVKLIGPALMHTRPAYNVRGLMVVYNVTMVALSLYLFVRMGQLGWFGSYNYKCQPVDYSHSDQALEVRPVVLF